MTTDIIRHGFGVTCEEAKRLVEQHKAKDRLYTFWTRPGMDQPYAVVRGMAGPFVIARIGDNEWYGHSLARRLTDGEIPPESVFDIEEVPE